MRFTILGFRQSVAVEKNITLQELMLLRWFIDFWTTGKMHWIEVEKKLYFWVDNSKALSELPILGITQTSNLRRLLRGMVTKKILHYHLEKGKYPYYRINTDVATQLLCSAPKPRRKRR